MRFIEFVVKNADKISLWEAVSSNPQIEWKDIVDHPELPWSSKGVSFNPSIGWNIVKENPFGPNGATWWLGWDANRLSANPSITYKNIKNNPYGPMYQGRPINPGWLWDVDWVSGKKDITAEDILECEDYWNYIPLSMNENIDIEFIVQHDGHDWDPLMLMRNKIVNWTIYKQLWDNPPTNEILLALRDHLFIENPNCRWGHINAYLPGSSYYMSILSTKSFINPDIIEANINLHWDYQALSRNRSISIDFVIKHINENWDWDDLSRTIHWDFILEHPDLPWNARFAAANKSLRSNIVERYPFGPKNSSDWVWNFDVVVSNPMSY